ncbi:MAG TPA: hypothetical protein VGE62_00275 [Candidatus Paceibacterota bacterium]
MKNLVKKVVGAVAVLLLLITTAVPSAAFAWSPGDPLIPNQCYDKTVRPGGCGWEDIVMLGQNLLHICLYITSLAAVITVTYAGWLYLTSGGNSSQISKAHGMLWKTVIGICFMLGAWLIVSSVLSFLQVEEGYSLLE